MSSFCEDRVCIVTGAGRGIGREYALMLAEHGAKVVVNERTGTIVMGEHVRLARMAISHGDLTIKVGTQKWYSTQTTAYALMAVSKFVGKNKPGGKVTFKYNTKNGKQQTINSNKTVAQIDIPVVNVENGVVEFTNTSTGVLYTRIIMEGYPRIWRPSSTSSTWT